MALWHLFIVGPLTLGVMWIAYAALRAATGRVQVAPGELQRLVLLLFAWSFVLGAVIRSLRL